MFETEIAEGTLKALVKARTELVELIALALRRRENLGDSTSLRAASRRTRVGTSRARALSAEVSPLLVPSLDTFLLLPRDARDHTGDHHTLPRAWHVSCSFRISGRGFAAEEEAPRPFWATLAKFA
jgi:hypothetical protein